ncbi:nucleoside recognition domain-containing protein [Ammonifex degensii]|uniref:nucleoside recognition domain-containing protein n=1 Tax=Ammonifex degensii TaxID=42838 RepID=UPI00145C4930|nr:nucleoside recognition domain-containing protein [Ammonifex degensii]
MAGDVLKGALHNVLIMGTIIFPLMIVLEVLQELPFWQQFSKKLGHRLSWFGMSESTAFPLLVGVIFGLTYSAGIIIEEVRKAKLHHREVLLLNLFLGLTHSVIEDTIIFLALGANLAIILGGRLALTVAIVFLVAKCYNKQAPVRLYLY